MLPAVSRRRGTAPLLRRSLRMQILKTTRGPPPSHSATDFPIRNKPSLPPLLLPSQLEIRISLLFYLILRIDSVTIPAGSPAMHAATHIRHFTPHLPSKISSFRINNLCTQFRATPVFSSDCAFPGEGGGEFLSPAVPMPYQPLLLRSILPCHYMPNSFRWNVCVMYRGRVSRFVRNSGGGSSPPPHSQPSTLDFPRSTACALLFRAVPNRIIPPPRSLLSERMAGVCQGGYRA